VVHNYGTGIQCPQAFAISLATAKRHVENIIAKLEVSGRTQGVVRALELGIVSFPEWKKPVGV
jgi:ATP/maltotriose-dependent transcriptional regulator MalT